VLVDHFSWRPFREHGAKSARIPPPSVGFHRPPEVEKSRESVEQRCGPPTS
jgi:hypothetical protein